MPRPNNGQKISSYVPDEQPCESNDGEMFAGLGKSAPFRRTAGQTVENHLPPGFPAASAPLLGTDEGRVMGTRQKPLMSVHEAAEMWGIGTTTAYEWLRQGELPGAVKHGGRWYVRRAVLEAYLAGADVLGPTTTQSALSQLGGSGRRVGGLS